MVMLLSFAIPKNIQAQSFGLEQNTDGSYTLYMEGGSVTTGANGSYNVNGYYDATGTYHPPTGVACNGCSLVGVSTYTQVVYQSPTNAGYTLSQQPPPAGTYTNTYMVAYNGSNEGAQFYLMNDGSSMYIPYGPSNTYTQATSYIQGCPSCEAVAAQQATWAELNAATIAAIQAETATQQAAALAYMQTQITNAWSLQNAALFYYYYYYNYYVGQIRNGYSGSVTALTPPAPPMMDVPRTDTSQPIQIPDTIPQTHAMDSTLTSILNAADTCSTQSMKDLRANVSTRKYEVGLLIELTNKYGPAISVDGYDTVNGKASSISLSYNYYTTIASVHTHPDSTSVGKAVDAPSPLDMRVAIEKWNYSFNHRFIAGFVVSGNPLHHNEWAVAVSDTNAAKTFLQQNNLNSIVDTVTHHWVGDVNDPNSPLGQFMTERKILKSEGYPSDLLDDYANVYMMSYLKMGIKYYLKVNGVFKELNFAIVIDSKGKKHHRITIAQ